MVGVSRSFLYLSSITSASGQKQHAFATAAKKEYEEEKDVRKKEKKKIAFEKHREDLRLLVNAIITIYDYSFVAPSVLLTLCLIH